MILQKLYQPQQRNIRNEQKNLKVKNKNISKINLNYRINYRKLIKKEMTLIKTIKNCKKIKRIIKTWEGITSNQLKDCFKK